ncbi:dehydrogenase/reductase SDR family member on chromosome X [Gadus chalcogrammus]|uniref:dehydrogenase/reductase SDR family member on chromosome X n=1 Tax=Gadus chalcogrammus TaxID=1042646 RepID=UPI0024C40130|nr:dehydrogenase/reductase SDR family member on chromosome X [Gadus chalcogrammus]
MWLLAVFVPLMRVYLCGVKVLIYQLFNRSFTLPVLPRQNGRVAIVTGGARGMGFEIARHLAGLGMHVLIAGNMESEGLAAVATIHQEVKEGKAEFLYLDMASQKSVRLFAQRFKDRGLPLHVLVNNAGVMLVPELQTEEGVELHYGLNFLGHFLLTGLLLETLARSGTPGRSARVVNMASATHYGGRLDLDNLNSRGCYSAHGAYAQSKVALVMFGQRLQRRAAARGLHVTANAADPGMVDTALYDFLSAPAKLAKRPFTGLLFRTPAEGASTAIYAAVSPELEGVGGRYLYNGEDRPAAACTYDQDLQGALWSSSCALAGLQDA